MPSFESIAEAPLFLSSDAKLDLLIQNWYAWPHLLAPVQCAMHFAFRQLPVLESFTETPSFHWSAASDPETFSGPYVHLAEAQLEAARNLLARMRGDMAPLLAFARAVKDFAQRLPALSGGLGLARLYESLPAPLQGLVELVYAADTHPTLRFIEPLAFGSELDTRRHEGLALSLVGEGERAFFLNTPLLPQPGRLILDLPFDDERIDLLAKLRTEPAPLSQVARQLEVDPEALRPFMTTRAPRRTRPDHTGDGIRIRYFGHACVLIQAHGTSILVDPVLGWDPGNDDTKLTFADLPDVLDYVVLTHGHQDHLCPEVLVQLRRRVKTVLVPRHNGGSIFDPSLKLIMQRLGFTDVRVLDPFDTVELPGGRLTSLPFIGEHADLDIHAKQGLHVCIDDRSILLLADSDAVDARLCERMADRLGHRVDALFIGMECDGAPLSWLYGPLATTPMTRREDESRRLSGSNADHAWNVVDRMNCGSVFVYAMGQDPWVRHLTGLEYSPDAVQLVEAEKFVRRCTEAKIPAQRLKRCTELVL